jgi:hypothetical protein
MNFILINQEKNIEKDRFANMILKKSDINSIAFAVFFEEEENGYFLGYFSTMEKAGKIADNFMDWWVGILPVEESLISQTYYLLSRHYKIDNTSYYSQYLNGDRMGSNGVQNSIVKRVDLNEFDLELFLYERWTYVNLIKKEQWDKLSDLHQELFGRMMAN